MNEVTLKIKNYLIVIFRITFMLISFSLPIIFLNAGYKNMISQGYYLWFSYFLLIFLTLIYTLIKVNYYELISAKIYGGNLHYKNLLIFKNKINLKNISGFRNGIDDEGNQYISLYSDKNKKIATLKINIYSNLPTFLNALGCENIGIELTNFQKIIQKIKLFVRGK